MAEAFPAVLRDPIEDDEHPADRRRAAGRGAHLSETAERPGPGAAATIATVEAPRARPAAAGGEVYTDDRAPVEWLIDRSILGYAAGE